MWKSERHLSESVRQVRSFRSLTRFPPVKEKPGGSAYQDQDASWRFTARSGARRAVTVAALTAASARSAGSRLGPTCAACGATVERSEKFCGSCGAPLNEPTALAARSPATYTPKFPACLRDPRNGAYSTFGVPSISGETSCPITGHRIRAHSPPPNPHTPAAQHERGNRRRLAEFIELRAIDLKVAELIVHEGRELAER